jgi:hypothetical protein
LCGGTYTAVSANQTAVTYVDVGLTSGVSYCYYYIVIARSAMNESPGFAGIVAAAQ